MGFAGTGIELRRGDGATTEVFTLVGELRTMTGPDGQATEIDRTHFQSLAKEFVMGLRDEGNYTFEGNFIGSDAQQQGVWNDRANRTKRNWELEVQDMPAGGASNTIFSFTAFVTQFSLSGDADGGLDFSITLRVTGAVTPVFAA